MKISYSIGNTWLFLFLYMILSLYIVYKQATDGNAVDLQRQEERHQRMLNGDSEFYNPWQYRMFSPIVVEGFYRCVNSIVGFIDRTEAFLLFRFIQNLIIFFVADLYFRSLGIQNPWLRLMGQVIMAFCMAHSVFQSDLSFNTYFDVLFYLLAAWLIIQMNIWWLVPLSALAAFNRETSALIPAMLLIPSINWKERKIPHQVLIVALLSVVAFVLVFFLVRWYYGFRPAEGIHGMRSMVDYVSFNLKFFRMYLELIGTLTIIPLVILLFLKRLPMVLRQWFWVVCPVWFAIHFAYSTAVETRLFLVPQVLIFIPAFLILVEGWYKHETYP